MYIIPRGTRRVELSMNTNRPKGKKVTLYLDQKTYELFQQCCQALGIPYSQRINSLIHEDLKTLLSLSEILTKKER